METVVSTRESPTNSGPSNLGLAARWQRFGAENPKVRIRDAARALATSEAELVAVGEGAVRLRAEWGSLLKLVPRLGRVMALTRNEDCVHERHGQYNDVSVTGHVALVLGEDIDLRIFLSQWKFGFAVREATAHGARRSLQFFDGAGAAVHKIYATEHTDMMAFESLVTQFADSNAALTTAPRATEKAALPDAEIDIEGLRARWRTLEDTHDFYGLLKKFHVKRTQALRLAGSEFAEPLRPSAARRALEIAKAANVPIMVFVGNPGCIQIHTGTVTNLRATGPWFNVLDPDFNLHLREDRIDTAWIVHKPTSDGAVTSIELFDAAGETIALFFGKRKPGLPELQNWRDVVTAVRAGEAV